MLRVAIVVAALAGLGTAAQASLYPDAAIVPIGEAASLGLAFASFVGAAVGYGMLGSKRP